MLTFPLSYVGVRGIRTAWVGVRVLYSGTMGSLKGGGIVLCLLAAGGFSRMNGWLSIMMDSDSIAFVSASSSSKVASLSGLRVYPFRSLVASRSRGAGHRARPGAVGKSRDILCCDVVLTGDPSPGIFGEMATPISSGLMLLRQKLRRLSSIVCCVA